MKKVSRNLINIIIKYMAIIMFLIIFVLLIFVDTHIEYDYSNLKKIDNLMCIEIILFISLIIFIIVKLINTRFNLYKLISKNEKLIIRSIFILLLIFQIIIIQNSYFKTGFDPGIILEAAEKYANTGVLEGGTYFSNYYFNVHHNNLFLASIFGIIIKIAMFFNISEGYKILEIISIILVDFSGIIMVKTIGNYTRKNIFKVVGAFIFAIFIGLSPWFFVPYSDTWSIIFPISILYNYTKRRKKFHDYLLIGIFSYLGYLIKPTNIIILIAIFILELYKIIFIKKKNFKKILKNALMIFIGIAIIIIFNILVDKVINYENDKRYNLSAYFYLMIGINKESTGTFSVEDMRDSLLINNYEERIAYNKDVFFQRLKEMSSKDIIEFYTKKMLINYNDGTFKWWRDGAFTITYNKDYKPITYLWGDESVIYMPSNENFISNILKELYFYNTGNLYYVFSSIMQVIWIFVLILTLMGTIFKRSNYKNSIIYLTLIGLTIFVLLFQARSTYLYVYSPYYIIAAIIGMEILYEKLKKR